MKYLVICMIVLLTGCEKPVESDGQKRLDEIVKQRNIC